MELLWLFSIIAGFGIIGWIYEQITEYLEQKRSKKRDEIAVNVLTEASINSVVKDNTEQLFNYVVKTIPRKTEETELYEIVTPLPAVALRDQLCPKCGLGFMVRRHGQYGTFLGCIRYPQCKSTKPVGWVNQSAKAEQKRAKEKQKQQYSKKFMEDLKKAYN